MTLSFFGCIGWMFSEALLELVGVGTSANVIYQSRIKKEAREIGFERCQGCLKLEEYGNLQWRISRSSELIPVAPKNPVQDLVSMTVSVIAHRGGGGAVHVENTIEAFLLGNQSTNILETDVGLSSDGQVVLWHDANMIRLIDSESYLSGEKTINGKTFKTKKAMDALLSEQPCFFSWPELQSLSLLGHSDEHIARLSDVLEVMEKDAQKGANAQEFQQGQQGVSFDSLNEASGKNVYLIDFKKCHDALTDPLVSSVYHFAHLHKKKICTDCESLIQETMKELNRLDLLNSGRLIFTSTQPRVLRRAKELAAIYTSKRMITLLPVDLHHLGYSYERMKEEMEYARADGLAVYYHLALLRPLMLHRIQNELKVPIAIWTVNDEKALFDVLTHGFGLIISDYPREMKSHMQRWFGV
eukprot:CAMPEP_0184696842 /NCGR_PEP_ID=MMETSP0313-20130426/4012_1 /TAXON_ID=2792 /ORGANISM="Porphyridium aerugineum, Strain SAG 1380-2" /LENGTH=413 /DNA_ID=CAMNT_0027155557 /DNA_START=148 /DNA_END=1389 /DNA_ORIENTATION=-